ncbi:MAG: class I tRNA ligase family protein, partial [Anaerolineales bacterium]|nr:class I tRNA ligase family protein [Anaerolineales bacterium]
EAQLPVDPLQDQPSLERCPHCGSQAFQPETDIMDTWATSSLSPQIVGQWLGADRLEPESDLFKQVYPFSLRPQAHEIIRTWAFYTIVQSQFHFDSLPWSDALISGWGIAGEGMGKISKSRGGGPMPPLEMIASYSADAVRYWAASTGPGKDAIISEEKIQTGARLANKLWNVARFSQRFLDGYLPPNTPPENLTSADRWLLDGLATLITRVTQLFETYDYAAAKAESESFFWSLADNYLEMAKQRLYDPQHPQHGAAQYCLRQALLTVLKLLAPLLPYISDAIYQELFAEQAGESIHRSHWPQPEPAWHNPTAQTLGDALLEIATAVRRYKSEHNLSLGSALKRVQLATGAPDLAQDLQNAFPDLLSITRAQQIDIDPKLDPNLEMILALDDLQAAIQA